MAAYAAAAPRLSLEACTFPGGDFNKRKQAIAAKGESSLPAGKCARLVGGWATAQQDVGVDFIPQRAGGRPGCSGGGGFRGTFRQSQGAGGPGETSDNRRVVAAA